jgi:hypothetical protein
MEILKKFWVWFLSAGILILLIIIALSVLFYFKSSKKRIVLYPEFKVEDIDDKESEKTSVLDEAAKVGGDILKRMKP